MSRIHKSFASWLCRQTPDEKVGYVSASDVLRALVKERRVPPSLYKTPQAIYNDLVLYGYIEDCRDNAAIFERLADHHQYLVYQQAVEDEQNRKGFEELFEELMKQVKPKEAVTDC